MLCVQGGLSLAARNEALFWATVAAATYTACEKEHLETSFEDVIRQGYSKPITHCCCYVLAHCCCMLSSWCWCCYVLAHWCWCCVLAHCCWCCMLSSWCWCCICSVAGAVQRKPRHQHRLQQQVRSGLQRWRPVQRSQPCDGSQHSQPAQPAPSQGSST